MTELGFTPSLSHPCVYFHSELNVQAITHVDDFMLCGARTHLEYIYQQLALKYELKRTIIGSGHDEAKKGQFLGKEITWTRGALLMGLTPNMPPI